MAAARPSTSEKLRNLRKRRLRSITAESYQGMALGGSSAFGLRPLRLTHPTGPRPKTENLRRTATQSRASSYTP
jgi:hypothetical protein